jgi:hypothetical protein
MTAFLRSLVNTVWQRIVAPAAATSTITSSGVDMLAYEGTAVVVIDVGAVSGTTPTLDSKIQDSADNSTGWADVAGATAAQRTATGTDTILIATGEVKRYVRYVGTIAGTTPSFLTGVTIGGFKKQTG